MQVIMVTIRVFLVLCFLFGMVETATVGLSPPSWLTGKPTWPEQTYYDEDGPPLMLNCQVKFDESNKILWLRDGQILSESLKSWSLSNENQTLTLDPPRQSQTGTYKCFISNSAGNISYSNYILIAERTETTRPRVIYTSPENQVLHAGLGENVTVWCIFDIGGTEAGLMDLKMNWVKNKTLVNDNDHTTWDISITSEKSQVLYLNITNLQVSDYGEYECVGSNSAGNDSRALAIVPPQPGTSQDHTWIFVSCGVGAMFIIGTVAMVILLYRRNYARSKYEPFDWPEPDVKHYDVPNCDLKYDVFVSYSSDDQDWVLNSLFHSMTNKSYEVCIDFKDFTPGVAISENILDAIYMSRKVIVVLSENFMKSVWGQFELSQALNRAVIQRNDVLILIRYSSCKIPGKLMGKTFLDWTSEEVRPHFWKRLFESVGEPGYYRNTGNQTSENQNGDSCEHQSCRSRENQMKDESNTSTSSDVEQVVSSSNVDCENTDSLGNFVGGEVKMIDVNSNFDSIDSDTRMLMENDSEIISIHPPVIQT